MNYNLMLDVGGTNINAGIIDQEGKLLNDEIFSFAAKAKAGEKEIFENFIEILNILTDRISDVEGKIGGVGMAFPGPFDYINGISLMKGLDKYDSIYGIKIADRIRQDFLQSENGNRMIENCPIVFQHDVRAFAMGELKFNGVREWNRIIYFCMGTGIGSAFSEDNRILKGGKDNVPQNGWIHSTEFRDGIMDDYLSIRGLAGVSRKILGEEKNGKELYELCKRGDKKAFQVYREFGGWLNEALVPFLDSFGPEGIVLGGQISKSFEYFGEEFAESCEKRGIQIRVVPDISRTTIEGLYVELQNHSVMR